MVEYIDNHAHSKESEMIEFREGKIVTDLEWLHFLEAFWLHWAGYSESDLDALWGSYDDEEITQEVLETDGIMIVENAYFVEPEAIILVQLGEWTWTIKGLSDWEIEAVVDKISISLSENEYE
ncbi:MAG: hypothetical protein UX12_C0015G0008 [Candidatus Collierbacteria bacterium GW2011_GWC1_45_47]|uniref:Uncharacterized protein n=3 Tax=Candidatus Collieribacteriota TaxID=1752725 RepID=A0A0G1HIR1_9BACT|nr:MAG: hypothetical protein UW35_C0013G0011 [Candidatus Collierbacteria bacterium GW2011_GWF2_44_15]KKU09382.1 MAG: hypothetical protein UX12_C0015G0008 [Candidatus Collierbacteria bacterium GW2011_GWC1_45_47]KKU28671.1 MAG: hypothetical protein UX41_C0029G0005 [Candidatus Collierbacteria bacterium GW2011_GWE1_46_18]